MLLLLFFLLVCRKCAAVFISQATNYGAMVIFNTDTKHLKHPSIDDPLSHKYNRTTRRQQMLIVHFLSSSIFFISITRFPTRFVQAERVNLILMPTTTDQFTILRCMINTYFWDLVSLLSDCDRIFAYQFYTLTKLKSFSLLHES